MAYRPIAVITSPVPIGDITKETYVDGCEITITDEDGTGEVIYSHTPRIRGRGNSTWGQPQKPFKVRSLNRQQTPFDYAASRDWALMADYIDESKMRTSVAYEVARRATGRWAPHSHHVDVTWNGNYWGLYRYSETADVQVGRVDVREMGSGDTAGNALTGPYVLEADSNYDDPGFRSDRWTAIMYDVPEVVGVPQQEAYIQGWINDFEDALVEGTEAEILARIDLDSWADWYLLQESMKNFDSRWERSCKFIKDQDAPNGTGKIILWPAWDFDLSLGLGWQMTQSPTGWWTRSIQYTEESVAGHNWINWLWFIWERSPVFRNRVRQRWDTAFRPVLESIGDYIDDLDAEIAPARTRDRARWHSGSALPAMHSANTIKSWIAARVAWMDAELPQLASTVQVSTSSEVAMRAYGKGGIPLAVTTKR